VQIEGWTEPLHCINVHLGLWARSRRFQLEWLCERIRAAVPKKGPLIVAGDFNDWHRRASHILEDELGLYEVFEKKEGKPAKSYPAQMPVFTLDRIYVRDLNVLGVERHVGAWAHVEHGIGMHVYLPAQRDAPTNMINNAMAVASAHKLRFGQDLILYNLELSESVDGFDGDAHKDAWNNDPIWQGVRENVEGITGIRDWAEAFFVATVIFEPLVGELFRSEFIMQAAAPQGDFVTPTLMGAGESDTARDLRVARALYGMLAHDEKHGEENRATMTGWLKEWTPKSLEAGRTLQPIWSQPGEKVIRFEESLEHSTSRFDEILGEFNLNSKELI